MEDMLKDDDVNEAEIEKWRKEEKWKKNAILSESKENEHDAKNEGI